MVPPLPSGVGDAIMKAFALQPSRQIGEIKRALEELIATGEIEPHQESEAYVEIVGKDRARFGDCLAARPPPPAPLPREGGESRTTKGMSTVPSQGRGVEITSSCGLRSHLMAVCRALSLRMQGQQSRLARKPQPRVGR